MNDETNPTRPGPKLRVPGQPSKLRTLKATDAEWAAWAAVAAERGETRSAWLRDVLNRAAKRGGHDAEG